MERKTGRENGEEMGLGFWIVSVERMKTRVFWLFHVNVMSVVCFTFLVAILIFEFPEFMIWAVWFSN